jgi:UDP-glucose:(heptosyl)LPS alpha-1,3-glucosyltransferase
MAAAPQLIVIRQRYTPFGGAERFIERALDDLVANGVRVRLLCREWRGDAPYPVTRIAPSFIGRRMRDAGFARLACLHVAASPGALVQSHERIRCCDIYRAGDGVHREWLLQRRRQRGSFEALLDRLSPYHRYVLQAERSLYASPRLKVVVCNSRMVKEEVERWYGLPSARVVVIPNAIDSTLYSPSLRSAHRGAVRRALELPDDSPLFLFVGSGYERKGLDSLLAAFARLKSMAFLAVVGKDRELPRYRKLARRLGVAGRVRFLGPQADAKPFFGAADALALPALYDPFPNVVLEAMATGLPVVMSTKCGTVDVIEAGGDALVCDALDVDALTAHLTSLLDRSRREVLGAAARAVAERLTPDRMTLAYQRLYSALLAGRLPET